MLVNKFAVLNVCEHLVEFFVRAIRHSFSQTQWKLAADTGESLQQLFVFRPEPINARGEHPLDCGWQSGFRKGASEPYSAVACQHTLFE